MRRAQKFQVDLALHLMENVRKDSCAYSLWIIMVLSTSLILKNTQTVPSYCLAERQVFWGSVRLRVVFLEDSELHFKIILREFKAVIQNMMWLRFDTLEPPQIFLNSHNIWNIFLAFKVGLEIFLWWEDANIVLRTLRNTKTELM